MKKLPIALKTPARVVIAVGAVILAGEFLIMLLIKIIHATFLKDMFLEEMAWEFIDPILLILLVAPALFLLIFKPMRAQQVELERQVDELGRFQRVGIGRELRMKELVEENTALRNPLAVEPAGDISVTSGSLEAPHHAAEQRITTQPTVQNQLSVLLFMLEDIERSQHQIEQAHQEWMAALDVMNDPIFLHDQQFRILRCNKAYQRCAGIPFKQIVGQLYYEVFPKTNAPPPFCLRVMEKTETAIDEGEMLIGDATYRSRAFSIHDKQGAYLHSVHILEDITERKQIEERLRASEQKFLRFFMQVSIPLGVVNKDGVIVYFNDRFTKAFGYTTDDVPTLKEWWQLAYPDESYRQGVMDSLGAAVAKAAKEGTDIEPAEYKVTCKSGAKRIVLIGGIPIEDNLLATFIDITERKRAEAAIQHANRALATLGAVNRTLVHATDEDELLQAICQSIVEQDGYRLAWVGYVRHDESKSIKIMAHAGHDEGYLDAMQLTWAETERGMGLSGRAVRSGTTQLCQDIANDPCCRPWRYAALQRGFTSSIALPLTRRSGKVFGILNVYAAETNAFSPNEVDLLEEMAGDMAFGVRSLHIRRQRDLARERIQQQLTQLQDSLEDTVLAIATIVEMRDPYIAGHQVRVANLAVAIATQMGLPDEQVHAIHLTGVMHDLGKIKVPAEILSKPGKITDIEFSLIKIHPQAGYDILKGIAFPWPIAQMVLQHHERMDGSGYPQGLKGEAILLEARILAVADVVEAMSSHRPYRPGLGIEVALEEITKQRGTYYDPQVVDACLALFREQGYAFKS